MIYDISVPIRDGGIVYPGNPEIHIGLQQAIARLPKVEANAGDAAISRDLNNLLNLTDKHAQKRGDTYIASVGQGTSRPINGN